MLSDSDITMKMLLDHMQAISNSLHQEIRTGLRRLDLKIDHVEQNLTTRIDRVELRVDRAERNLTQQIDAVDKRLDVVEIEQLPKRVRVLEQKLGVS